MAGPGDQLDPLIPALFAVRLVTVRFQVLPVLHFPDQITTGRVLKVNLLLEQKLSSSDSRHSHSLYDVCLGLHPYLRNGG